MTGQIGKVLSANDIGKTGAHQAGVLVPRTSQILSFFPRLDSSRRNPRVILPFIDDAGSRWEFAFIYYNNKFFGGTRNEYRLTRMTKYIRQAGLVAGDEIILSQREGLWRISVKKKDSAPLGGKTLKLGGAWRVVSI